MLSNIIIVIYINAAINTKMRGLSRMGTKIGLDHEQGALNSKSKATHNPLSNFAVYFKLSVVK